MEDQLAKTNERLHNLAAVRAEYANQVAEVKNRSVLLERAQQNLAEARAARASAKAASLISRIDAPDAGIRPIGPSRAVIALCGVLGGLLAGFGVLFLVVPVHAGVPAAAPAIGSNGHGRGVAAGHVAGGNGSTRSPLSADGHLSVKQALQTLAN